jgi:DNA-binding transcriptional MerR regulator
VGWGRIVSVTDCVRAFPLASTEAESFTIGELAAEFGITARALRFYEEEGLIAPRRDGATRIYSRRDRARIVWLLRGKSVGFSLDEIGELLNLYDLGDGRVKQRTMTASRCRLRAEELRGQISALQTMQAQLSKFAEHLEQQH